MCPAACWEVGSRMVKVMGTVSLYTEVREKTGAYPAVLRCLGLDTMVLRSRPILGYSLGSTITMILPKKPPRTEHGPAGMI